ncbi:HD domain-containing protein [Cellulophaga sp. 20_2_10]|uniref:HD domain-containing protein n=1 Tax=Cellulophaga sp. 20_2_10 TaxID=2942476 RepID=UPI00201A798F|nr:HD domain-containing protein [Cellulophaga sp. 20_2_10]
MSSSVAAYCTDLLTISKCKELPFHNLEHTKEVVQNVKYLCAAMDINHVDTELLIVSAWFHDTGFSKTYKGHEDESKKIATKFLLELGIRNEMIENICLCIDATKMPQNPTTVLAAILCDADFFHISTPHFYYRKLLLRREWEMNCKKRTTDKKWHQLNLDFLKNVHFKTEYGKNALEVGKQENIKKVQRILEYYDE